MTTADVNPTSGGLLHGMRVLDFSHLVAGPMCTMLLADAGADVIKVEPPWGDGSRRRGPVRATDAGQVTSYLAAGNRGKRSVVLDIKDSRAHALVERLIAASDVVVENFAPGAIARMGFSLDELRERQPRLITASISLFGRRAAGSTLASRPGLAVVAEAESGLASLCTDNVGTPIQYGIPLGDTVSGLVAYSGILMALAERERSGVGRHVDVSMVSSLLALNGCFTAGHSIDPVGVNQFTTAPYGYFRSTDGFVAIACNVDELWVRLTDAMNRPELAEDPRFADYRERDKRVQEVKDVVTAWTSERTSTAIVALLTQHAVPCGIVNDAARLREEPEYRGLGLFATVDDGIGGTLAVPANPFGLSGDGARLPQLGEHTDEVLLNVVGVAPAELAELRASGVVGAVRLGERSPLTR
jgi:crotonobetainyl-CoA:carnitine CoA-transferase CaiB-like acyl-CoA transferase